ncbi:polysaccharide pyruvyl transferase family protein [Bacteroides mediterraneensis]|nr:polysaccharide pyruvyl transferase family protein [Bacteroides mediterraneensis]
MKRIGIITIHSDLNYGAALQAYALNEFLRNRGYQAEIINYIKIPNHPRKYPFPINIAYWIMNRPRFTRYRKFLKESISKKSWHSVNELMNNFNEPYDILISGSDQVWNPTCGGLINKLNPCYYLAFADQRYKKIAYASSLGSYRFNKEEIKYVKKWLEEYSHLSTREQAGKEHLESFLDRKIKVVLDPTLLLNREEWLKVSKYVKKMRNEKYVLVYYIDEIAECVEYARKIANKYSWKVAMMTNTAKKFPGVDINIPFCGPAEFLWLFDNAQYIVTNSFHGTAFSVNFNKNFISVIKRNSPQRAQTLLNNVGLSNRLLTDINQIEKLEENIDWSTVNKKLNLLRSDSIEYLINAIEK